MMNPKSIAKEGTEKDLSRKSGKQGNAVEVKGQPGFGQRSRWGEHSNYDWMDHFSLPDSPLW
ncbi:hypothetical protein BX592_12990 [Paraburkholderia rhizosphaerae]|uniref:Uncharacterized protein n=1 Tax=Paraburkholderia rhizosphaerae TaxID=480658 RepID=A0A4R8L8B8_9BURK|nr:hypothetical protein BX592_12990 [Paraburkholderia rhizosphaerae]